MYIFVGCSGISGQPIFLFTKKLELVKLRYKRKTIRHPTVPLRFQSGLV